jgi:glucose/arabinose dehydrogenase
MTMRLAQLRSVLAVAMFLAATRVIAGDVMQSEKARFVLDEIAIGLQHPWGLAFLPDGRMIVTEKPGRLRIIEKDGKVGPALKGVPKVDVRGQGGLLDVTLDPQFAANRFVYVTFSEPGKAGENSTAALRGKLSDDNSALEEATVIFSQKPKVASTGHFGSRLVFDREGNIFISLGERQQERFRGQAQDLGSHLGKVVRIKPDGSVPAGNPFASKAGALPEIWTYGHRNVQAAAINPASGELWTIEHGPRGGDEINIDRPGLNFGWPLVSYGVNYDGTPVNEGKQTMEGVTTPIYQWTPVIAPSGMIFYSGNAFPDWKGNLFVGGLAATSLVRLELQGDRVVHEERLLTSLGHRIRDVAQAPDGKIHVITDEDDGKVLRLAPQ